MHRYTVRSDSTNISRASTFKIVFVFEKRPKYLEKVRLVIVLLLGVPCYVRMRRIVANRSYEFESNA